MEHVRLFGDTLETTKFMVSSITVNGIDQNVWRNTRDLESHGLEHYKWNRLEIGKPSRGGARFAESPVLGKGRCTALPLAQRTVIRAGVPTGA